MTADEIAKSPAFATTRRTIAGRLLAGLRLPVVAIGDDAEVTAINEKNARLCCRNALRVADLLIEESQK